MKTRIVRIGNGYRVRIPKALLEQTCLHGQVEISAELGTLVIQAWRARHPREGWVAAFRELGPEEDEIAAAW
jgi:antitoxin component of MazEF toxin-antitoxin module